MSKLYAFYKTILVIILGVGLVAFSIFILASPQGGNPITGGITITSDTDNGIDTLITQQEQKGIINWQSFNIDVGEHTHFNQLVGPSAVTLNRVVGGSASSILGKLSATGHVWLLNPSGILFGPNARIDVAGLLATTANISNENFLAGHYYFNQGLGQNAKVINQGYIKIADNGMVFLVAPEIENSGVIEATLGKVVLGSTPSNTAYVLDFYGDQLLQFALPPDVGSNIDNAIIQSGKITAPGGKILLTVNTARSVVDKAINMSGIIEANTVVNKGGNIVLLGGEKGIVSVTGKITARGNDIGQGGGKVVIKGEKVGLFSDALIDVSGMSEGGVKR